LWDRRKPLSGADRCGRVESSKLLTTCKTLQILGEEYCWNGIRV